MDDRRAHTPTEPPDPDHYDDESTIAAAAVDAPDGVASDGIDLSSLSIAGITKRRVGWLCAALAAAWIVVIFARQASEGATAAARADQVAAENAALAAEVTALEYEKKMIERPAYIAQQARGIRIGAPNEIPFTLDPSVPSPGPNAPGSAAAAVGADEEQVTPLESWLSLLFGPAN